MKKETRKQELGSPITDFREEEHYQSDLITLVIFKVRETTVDIKRETAGEFKGTERY